MRSKPGDRTPMGEYIVPPGGCPLTSLGDHQPGPSDYTPKLGLTKSSSPQYSIVGKQGPRKNKTHPGPADYDTGGDLVWKNRKATLKAREKAILDNQVKTDSTSIGPDKYFVENLDFGKGGAKYSIARRQPQDMCIGPPNKLVQPGDTHGFETPGPDYRPNSAYWGRGHQKSIGSGWRMAHRNGPGPADYKIGEPSRGPAYSLSMNLALPQHLSINKDSPAPNIYDLGTTVGTAVAVSITGRRETNQGIRDIPSPSAYTLKDSFDLDRKTASLTYRRFEPKEPPHPGPADYSITKPSLHKAPSYTCRRLTVASYPDTLKYVDTKEQGAIPGPGSYNLSKKFIKNDKPAYSIGNPGKTYPKDGPGPNEYQVEKFEKPGASRQPKYSMAKRLDKPTKHVSPGPAAYYPSVSETGPKFSMTKRYLSTNKVTTPGPNAYCLPSGQTVRGKMCNAGVVIKSRGSPYVYSGFRTNKLSDPQPVKV